MKITIEEDEFTIEINEWNDFIPQIITLYNNYKISQMEKPIQRYDSGKKVGKPSRLSKYLKDNNKKEFTVREFFAEAGFPEMDSAHKTRELERTWIHISDMIKTQQIRQVSSADDKQDYKFKVLELK